ncbi:MAG: hypothetical protein IPL61_12160 [Myxococcales bacterium]|nr:hypothetical protein [Myxococcales bacterium]
MSELHYDADGEPAKLPAAAEEFRVRRFRKPGERGACEIVHGADGAPLYVAVDTTYNEFRTLVDGVAGRYRLDPVDGTRAVCRDAVPMYVTIDPARRNGGGQGEEASGMVRELMRANVEMMRANVEMTKHVTERLAGIMSATSEILRAADGANLPRREPLPPLPVTEVDDQEDEDDDDQDAVNPLAIALAHLLEQATPMLGTYMAERMARERRAQAAASAPAAASPAPAPAPAAPSSEPAAPAPATATPAAPTSDASASADLRNAAPPPPAAPTPEQIQHLFAVRAKLSPDEQRVVMAAIPRMDPIARAEWMTTMCALPVDDAAELVRSMMPPLRTRKEPVS